jgi:hypothetical protein
MILIKAKQQNVSFEKDVEKERANGAWNHIYHSLL